MRASEVVTLGLIISADGDEARHHGLLGREAGVPDGSLNGNPMASGLTMPHRDGFADQPVVLERRCRHSITHGELSGNAGVLVRDLARVFHDLLEVGLEQELDAEQFGDLATK